MHNERLISLRLTSHRRLQYNKFKLSYKTWGVGSSQRTLPRLSPHNDQQALALLTESVLTFDCRVLGSNQSVVVVALSIRQVD